MMSSEPAAGQLNKLTGVRLRNMEATPSEIFEAFHPGRRLPEFGWLKIDGKPGMDDFGIVGNGELIVSAKALAVLKSFNLNYCDATPYPAPPPPPSPSPPLQRKIT